MLHSEKLIAENKEIFVKIHEISIFSPKKNVKLKTKINNFNKRNIT